MAIKDYLEELARTAGLDEVSRGALLKLVENEKFAKELEAGVSRQSDYSRNMDALKTQKSAVETQIQTWRDWYNTAIENDTKREAELQELRTKVGTGGGGGGAGGGGGNGGMSKAELERLLAQERSNLIALTKDMGKVASRHAAEFHEALDVDALEKLALEKGLRVTDAYELFIKPRTEANAVKKHADEIAAARAEGVKEGMSKQGIPDDAAVPRGHSAFFDRITDPAKVPDARTRAANFAEAWNGAAAGAAKT